MAKPSDKDARRSINELNPKFHYEEEGRKIEACQDPDNCKKLNCMTIAGLLCSLR